MKKNLHAPLYDVHLLYSTILFAREYIVLLHNLLLLVLLGKTKFIDFILSFTVSIYKPCFAK